jgi:hypothetical protein
MTEPKAKAGVEPRVGPPPPQGAHKNPVVGPTTNKPLAGWRLDRDYENFNPTPDK